MEINNGRDKYRIVYLDSVKGIAILLVVMGHVISWCNPGLLEKIQNDTEGKYMLWQIIYSFHMPLFVFCSGLFQTKADKLSSMTDLLTNIAKRFKGLMIPYFIVGSLYWIYSGRNIFYWYLLIIFEFYALSSVVIYVTSKMKIYKKVMEPIILLLIAGIFWKFTGYLKSYEKLPLIDIEHLSLYLYYVLGYFAIKYKVLTKIVANNIIYTVSLVLFFASIYILLCTNIILPLGITSIICAISAIIIIVVLSYTYLNNNQNRITRLMSYLGSHSLEIYLIHLFVPIAIPMNNILLGLGGAKYVMTTGVIYFVLTIIDVLICLSIIKIVYISSHLKFLCFGKK